MMYNIAILGVLSAMHHFESLTTGIPYVASPHTGFLMAQDQTPQIGFKTRCLVAIRHLSYKTK